MSKQLRRIACSEATCRYCTEGVEVDITWNGDRLYVCPERKRRHKEISGGICEAFRCENYRRWNICSECRGGK